MSFDAGSVVTTLGGRLDPAGFRAFDAANQRAIESATKAEAAMASAGQRASKANDEAAAAAGRHARATENLAGSARRLGNQLPLSAMNAWSRNSAQAEKNLSKLGSVAAKGAGVGLLSLAAATVYAAKTAGDFEKQMRNVNSIAKLSEEGYRNLSKGVLSLAGETAQAPKVLAEGLYQLVSSGFNASDSLTILKSSAKAATAGLTDTATATTAVAAVLNAYREPASKASNVSDILFETVNRGVLTFAELSKEIGTVLPFASSLGVTLPEVGAAISTMTKEGISAPETMTRIKQAMVSIIKPSADMAKAIKATGAESGQALVEQKGFQGALEALLKTTDGSKESMAKLFPNIRALGGVLALTGHNAKSAQQDLKAFQDTGGATQRVFNEQAKGAEFAGKRLVSSFQTAGVIVGEQVLPMLAAGAGKLTKALQGAAHDGSLESFGNTIVGVFSGIGTVIGDIAPDVASAVKSLYDIGAALSSVGSSVGLGLPTQIEALGAAFLTFKAVGFIGPIIASTVGALASLGAAVGEGGLLALPGAFLALENPITAIAAVIGIAAAGFVALQGGLFSSTSAAEKNAAAMQHDKEAISQLQGATDGAAKAHFAARRAALAHKEAAEHLKQVEKEAGDGTIKGTQKQNALLDARLRVAESAEQETQAHAKATQALDAEVHSIEKAKVTIGSRQRETLKQLETLEEESQALGKRNFILSNGEMAEERRNKLQAEYNRQSREAAQANAQVAVSEESRRRIEAGKGAITAKNAQGVQQLQRALGEANAPQKIVTRYELDDQGAQAKLGQLSAQLSSLGQQRVVAKVLTTAPSAGAAILAFRAVLAGVPAHKVVAILHNAPSAKAAMGQLHGAISAVQSSKHIAISTNAAQARGEIASVQSAVAGLSGKTIQIAVQKTTTSVENVVRHAIGGHASGRGSGARELALVGEGRGSEYVIDGMTGRGELVSRPTLMGLGRSDYVVPLEEQFRGRAMGLFAMLAGDLGVPGYKGGKAGKGKAKPKPMPIPDAINPLSLPVSDIESKRDAAKTAEGKERTKVKSESSKIASLEKSIRTASRAKKPDHAKLAELRGELGKQRAAHGRDSKQLAKDKQELKEWNRTVREAKAFAARIKHVELEVANDRNAMQLAAGHGDFDAYTKAKNKRIKDLGRLGGLIAEAKQQVKTGSDYALELEGQIQQAQIEAGATANEEPEPVRDKAAEEEENTAMTADERAQKARIERDIALAALTPDLSDDKAHAQELVGFLEHVLGETKAEPSVRGGDEGITQVANALKTAQSNLASLTTGSGTNENADLQAQIDQANQKADVAKQQAQTAERALEVFGGAGDIGAGGRNAAGAAGFVQNNYMLHPSDPEVLRTIGNAATVGIGFQGSRRSVRVRVGP